MKNPKKTGALRGFMMWPLYMVALNIVATVALYTVSREAGRISLAFTITLLIAVIVLYLVYRNRMNRMLVAFASEYSHIQKTLLDEMLVPYALADSNGHMLWMNDCFLQIAGRKMGSFFEMFPDIKKNVFTSETDHMVLHSAFGGSKYQIDLKQVSFDNETGEIVFQKKDHDSADMYAIYLLDETEKLELSQKLWDQDLAVLVIYIDNYEEALESVEEVRRSLLLALVDRKMNKYFTSYGGVIRKTERDKYFAIVPQKYFAKMQEERFSLLSDVKTVNIGNEIAMTISMGAGIGQDGYAQNFEAARNAIDMALGRGGDQCVVKRKDKIEYFGGKSESAEKYTRVKARVKAHALRELIESKEKVLIMGHARSDIDAIGAALGIYRAATVSGKKAYIVLDERIPAILPMVERIESSPEYDANTFVTTPKAKEIIDENTVLVVVDVNRPSITQSPDLLKKTKHIVVLDHHRQTKEIITGAVLSYIEPYASSACEMVAEVLQYYTDNIKLKSLDADAMYAGILVDTDNFQTKTGVRTFEAAAYLKRSGADMVRVRKMFKDDLGDYRVRAQAVARAELYHDRYALSECSGETQESITVVAAQAANELLSIRDVRASFVFSKVDDTVYISARSIDEINVQLVMEQLGGGGHLSVAGAQLKDISIFDAKERLKQVLVRMEEDGEI